MQLENRFTIPVTIARAWEVLLDVERVVPCFPGAAVTSVAGDSIEGSVRIKFGPVLLHYAGTATFLEKDEAAHRAVLTAQGSDRKGGGSAGATITAQLYEIDGASTECAITTDLEITGRPAQFGRGIMSEVGNRITAQFASNLSAMLTAPEAASAAAAGDGAAASAGGAAAGAAAGSDGPAAASTSGPAAGPAAASAAAPRPQPAQSDDALDVLKFAQGAALKRLAPVLGAALLLLVWSALRGRGSRQQVCCAPCGIPPRI
jgi:carbon monoxide dehydrogenase subunit G